MGEQKVQILQNRHEFLFLYDVTRANPNGDPSDEDRPRIDEETGINVVTDVRLKRTIRDALQELGYEIFLREERDESGNLKTKDDLVKEYCEGKVDPQKILERCIDVRLFGGTFALKKEKNGKGQKEESRAFNLIGPVQFQFGHSLHRVKVEYVKGSSIIPSGGEKKQGTLTEMYVVAYSLIVFYGVANEKNAALTSLTEEDVDAMLKAMWVGHKAGNDVLTRSKMGHEPRLLIDVVYKKGTLTQMGELDKLVKFRSDLQDESIRDIEDGVVDLSALVEKVKRYGDKVEKVRVMIGDRVKIEPAIDTVFQGIKVEEFAWAKEI